MTCQSLDLIRWTKCSKLSWISHLLRWHEGIKKRRNDGQKKTGEGPWLASSNGHTRCVCKAKEAITETSFFPCRCRERKEKLLTVSVCQKRRAQNALWLQHFFSLRLPNSEGLYGHLEKTLMDGKTPRWQSWCHFFSFPHPSLAAKAETARQFF